MSVGNSLFDCAHQCLMANDPGRKVELTQELREAWLRQDGLDVDKVCEAPVRIEIPGRPELPKLVLPADVPKRSFDSIQGRIKLAHAIAHIEFNAINLALDAIYRFRDMPTAYYSDWLRVAAEEASHFTLLNQYLIHHESNYGAYSAHNGLWEMALKTDHDALVRMALVPRVLEARGLDVTVVMIKRLQKVDDIALADILKTIYQEEIGHVQIGNHWFNYLCEQKPVDSETMFKQLIETYIGDARFGPFDYEARKAAGFSKNELEYLAARNRK